MRRVVTGLTKEGKSVFVSDGEPPRSCTIEELPSFRMTEVWATEDIPTIPNKEGDITTKISSLIPGIKGTQFRVVWYYPEQELIEAFQKGADVGSVMEQMAKGMPGLAEAMEPDNPGMHTTDTIDYGVVISGEVYLELDDGAEVHLKPGDCVVQNGTRHAWRNRGSAPCAVAFVMIGAKRITAQ
jgi:mannose-6-phosphate isomerase-like protein (cupin superfamily)